MVGVVVGVLNGESMFRKIGLQEAVLLAVVLVSGLVAFGLGHFEIYGYSLSGVYAGWIVVALMIAGYALNKKRGWHHFEDWEKGLFLAAGLLLVGLEYITEVSNTFYGSEIWGTVGLAIVITAYAILSWKG
ncbi:hypothetical protein [Methanonatronarchaeum sp. AMET6-2]|uniref:hypothetical protein n=1 Tax=Methanonatronarchaeum sp. AMET6-2 TaxID=2933293 RepID=UPI001FF27F40|nr:hypothetical protein [Methanonatronarchaeum sp. AMET6-2]UOY10058.1 hypothetical protein MU439_07315 [Methanonatronarchaeum sp. AMET6-2]